MTSWLAWAVIAGIKHEMDGYTTTDGIVTAQTAYKSGRPTASCHLELDYFVIGQRLHGLARVNGECSALPGPGSRARLNVAASDPYDIWIEGADDANHPNPVLFSFFLLVAPPAAAFAFMNELTDYRGVRKLIASGTEWRQVRATVTSKTANRSGVTLGLEAVDLSGKLSPFNILYKFVSPIGPVRKGDTMELTLIANGQWQALMWRSDRRNRIHLTHIAQPPQVT